MELTDKINELINLLNPEEDNILIISLQMKKEQIKQEYLSKHEVSSSETSLAMKGVQKTLQSWKNKEYAENIRLSKINTIIDNSRKCTDCNNSITYKYEHSLRGKLMLSDYQAHDKNSIKCKSCQKWKDLLINEQFNEKYKIDSKYNFEIPLEFYETKALITKIQNKLSIIKKSQQL